MFGRSIISRCCALWISIVILSPLLSSNPSEEAVKPHEKINGLCSMKTTWVMTPFTNMSTWNLTTVAPKFHITKRPPTSTFLFQTPEKHLLRLSTFRVQKSWTVPLTHFPSTPTVTSFSFPLHPIQRRALSSHQVSHSLQFILKALFKNLARTRLKAVTIRDSAKSAVKYFQDLRSVMQLTWDKFVDSLRIPFTKNEVVPSIVLSNSFSNDTCPSFLFILENSAKMWDETNSNMHHGSQPSTLKENRYSQLVLLDSFSSYSSFHVTILLHPLPFNETSMLNEPKNDTLGDFAEIS
ncbi:hypothetical protein HMI54_014304 [Coelomomyces lativittatus]|nr:hypothetical protein HMI56_000981 [Coelomomyces lativittatus]KAJ1510528.1 hypothetical protein HMI55_006961 [Coelomomyces lativittatus]KAJ1514294.1 hypothetical protein HMI54_014304 [Coelomomyces lativittatus]